MKPSLKTKQIAFGKNQSYCQKSHRMPFVQNSPEGNWCYTLHYITLHYTTLHYTTLHYTTLHCTALHYTTLHYTTLHYTTLHYTYLCGSNWDPVAFLPWKQASVHLTEDTLCLFCHQFVWQLCFDRQYFTKRRHHWCLFLPKAEHLKCWSYHNTIFLFILWRSFRVVVCQDVKSKSICKRI